MLRLLTALAALLWFGAALPAHAQLQPVAADTWLGCPAGFALETAPDPRLLTPPAALQRAEPRLVVRCVARGMPVPPSCPPGTRAAPVRGADRCTSGPPSAIANVSDGTSNTVMFGETQSPSSQTMGDGSVRTVSNGETPPAPGLTSSKGSGTIATAPMLPAPTCVVSRRLTVDPGGTSADTCEFIGFALPADRVSIPPQ
jgi:hypothetical protein